MMRRSASKLSHWTPNQYVLFPLQQLFNKSKNSWKSRKRSRSCLIVEGGSKTTMASYHSDLKTLPHWLSKSKTWRTRKNSKRRLFSLTNQVAWMSLWKRELVNMIRWSKKVSLTVQEWTWSNSNMQLGWTTTAALMAVILRKKKTHLYGCLSLMTTRWTLKFFKLCCLTKASRVIAAWTALKLWKCWRSASKRLKLKEPLCTLSSC